MALALNRAGPSLNEARDSVGQATPSFFCRLVDDVVY